MGDKSRSSYFIGKCIITVLEVLKTGGDTGTEDVAVINNLI